jgi:hypothetical protein
LAADEPETLQKKERQHGCCDLLRQVEAEAAKDLEPVGHYVRGNPTSLNRGQSAAAIVIVLPQQKSRPQYYFFGSGSLASSGAA